MPNSAGFGFKLARRKIVPLLGVAVATFLSFAGIFLLLLGFLGTTKEYENIASRFVLTIFLPQHTDSVESLLVRNYLLRIPIVDSVKLITAEEAYQNFTQRYGNITPELFDENQFPPSILTYLKPGALTQDSVRKLEAQIRRDFPQVDITYRKDFLQIFEKRSRQNAINAIVIGATLILTFGFLLFLTTRSFFTIDPRAIKELLYLGFSRYRIFAPYLWTFLAVAITSILCGNALFWFGYNSGIRSSFPNLTLISQREWLFLSGISSAAVFLLLVLAIVRYIHRTQNENP